MSTALKNVQKFFPQVKRVVDANKPEYIEVTKEDAHPSGKKKHDECALAVACKKKLKLDGVIISRSIAYLVKGGQARRFKLTETASREIVSFDRDAGFEPGTYELAAIAKSSKLGARPENRPRGERGSQGPRPPRHITNNVRHVLGGQRQKD